MKKTSSAVNIKPWNELKNIEEREWSYSPLASFSNLLASPKNKLGFRDHIISTNHLKNNEKMLVKIAELDRDTPKENKVLTQDSSLPDILSSKIKPRLNLSKARNSSSHRNININQGKNINDAVHSSSQSPTGKISLELASRGMKTPNKNNTGHTHNSFIYNSIESCNNIDKIPSPQNKHEPNLLETYKFLESLGSRKSTSEILLSAGLLYKDRPVNQSHKKSSKNQVKSSYSPRRHYAYSPIPDTYSLSLQCVDFLVEELQKPGFDRDVDTMYDLTRHLKFFIQYKADIVKQMLRVANYEFYNKGQMIFKEGDVGRCLYVVLRGSIAVQQEPIRLGEMPYIVNSRYDGEVIGEYAIVRGNINNANDKRTASCFSGEKCHLIKITAEDYMKSVRANIDVGSKILTFLCGLGPFEHIPSIDLALLANTLNKVSYGLEEPVLEANSIPKGMFIVYQGRVKITYPAKIAQYSESKNKISYKMSMKDFQLPRGSYFGQRVLAGDRTPAKYSVISASAQTSILAITPHEFSLLFTFKDETLKYLTSSPQFDLNPPHNFS
ncbi:unnamed protein product [Blepharisma stoltei]|uniref:Cyclic nucleotide-binding domain-containing protein n=1 Tax=Blepharisma stoltei TaxID=1481888 RepID=A0AAU9II13_9CILI|nr:unnamed protein product [Blepharisma stoltei]